MKKKEIRKGAYYVAKVNNKLTTVRVDDIREYHAVSMCTAYHVTNMATGRKTIFRSAQKFRRETSVIPTKKKPRPAKPAPHTVQQEFETVKPKTCGDKQSGLADALRKRKDMGVDKSPHLIVEALAGTGKTTTLVEGLKRVLGQDTLITPSPQQAAIWEAMELSKNKAHTVGFVAFNKAIAVELQGRVPLGCSAMTMHSMGFSAIRRVFDGVQVSSFRVQDIISDILNTDSRDLRRERMPLLQATERLVSLCKMNLVAIPDIPVDGPQEEPRDYHWWTQVLNNLASQYDVDLNGNGGEVFELVPEVLERCKDVTRDGKINFDDMIWLPVALGLNIYRYDLLLIDEAQDLNRCQQALAMKAGRRLILCGDHKQCLVEDTEIRVTGENEPVAIQDLKVGQSVVAFNPNSGYFCGERTQGKKITAIRVDETSEDTITIETNDNHALVECTQNHRWWARFSPDVRDYWCLYVMRRGSRARIGICKLNYSCGLGPAARARSEKADAVWILDIFRSEVDARVEEQVISYSYGLPQLTFCNRGEFHTDQEIIDAVYEELGDLTTNLEDCLCAFGRLLAYPIWESATVGYLSFTKGAVYHACNLICGAFQLRVYNDTRSGTWETVNVSRLTCFGKRKVYGLTVEPTERGLRLYVANNFVSHNSIYGFAGADAKSMDHMEATLNATERGCQTLPLTVTRRCGRAIVREAQKLVPNFEAHETCCDGRVTKGNYKDRPDETKYPDNPQYKSYCWQTQDGDMILCRVNAPLVSECFKFLKMGRKANIRGRDVGQGLVATVKKITKGELGLPVADLWRLLGDWLDNEEQKEQAKRNPSDARLIALHDRHDCIACFTEDQSTAGGVIQRIEAIFTDNKHGEGVMLSSIHKAKGLEAKRVFLLQPEGATIPHPMAKTPQQREQESNLLYVAITRAIEELVYVS